MSKKVELILMLQKKQEKNVNITKTFSLHPVILHSIHRRVRRMRHAAVELADAGTVRLAGDRFLVWLTALWLHLNHGIWSAMQTMGVNNKTWFRRLKNFSTIYTTITLRRC